MAERYDPTEGEFNPPSYPKSSTAIAMLTGAMGSHFLFSSCSSGVCVGGMWGGGIGVCGCMDGCGGVCM